MICSSTDICSKQKRILYMIGFKLNVIKVC